MSVEVMTAVFKGSRSTANDRVVLLVLADHASDDGTGAYPSQRTIAAKANIGERTVRDCLKRLASLGEIERESLVGRTNRVVSYRVRLDLIRQESPDSIRQADAPNPADSRHLIRQTAADKPSENHQGNPTPPNSPPAGFEEWLAHHEQVTGHLPPRAGTKAREAIEASYRARRAERWGEDELRLATIGAHADPWRQENAYDVAESVLRPTKIAALVNRGRRVENSSRPRGQLVEGVVVT